MKTPDKNKTAPAARLAEFPSTQAGVGISAPPKAQDLGDLPVVSAAPTQSNGLSQAVANGGASPPAFPKISASVLGIKDEPEDEIIRQCLIARRAGVDLIHFDVVGGGGKKTPVVEAGSEDTSAVLTAALLGRMKQAARRAEIQLPVDVHIMDMQPSYAAVRQWLLQGADRITVHWEAYRDRADLTEILRFIGTHGAKAGIALRPDTGIAEILNYIEENPSLVGMVNQAGVLPCLGGQVLQFGILKNLRVLRELGQRLPDPGYEIMVDGGIEPEIAGPRCFRAGADILVAGTAFFGRGKRDQETLVGALRALKVTDTLSESSIYEVLADRIVELRNGDAPHFPKKAGKAGSSPFRLLGNVPGFFRRQIA